LIKLQLIRLLNPINWNFIVFGSVKQTNKHSELLRYCIYFHLAPVKILLIVTFRSHPAKFTLHYLLLLSLKLIFILADLTVYLLLCHFNFLRKVLHIFSLLLSLLLLTQLLCFFFFYSAENVLMNKLLA
jgi:hypothetical protein